MQNGAALLQINDVLSPFLHKASGSADFGTEIRKTIQDMPGDFSIKRVEAILEKLPHCESPKGHVELPDYLQAVGKAIVSGGTSYFQSCTCGCTLEEHIVTVYKIFLSEYILSEALTEIDLTSIHLLVRIDPKKTIDLLAKRRNIHN